MKHLKTPDFSLARLKILFEELLRGFCLLVKKLLSHPFEKEKLFSFLRAHLPNNKDNIFQMAAKVTFIAVIIGSIISTSCFFDYFSDIKREHKAMAVWTDIWNSELNDIDTVKDRSKAEIFKILDNKNRDFEAWLKIGKDAISAPVFKTDNNNYYKTHNGNRKGSEFGTLYFDKAADLSSEDPRFNNVIYGNNIFDGSLFGSLEDFRSLEFFRKNYSVTLYAPERTATYKIFAAFIYDPEDDFKLLDAHLVSDEDFSAWAEEIYRRSFVIAEIPLNRGDTFLTFITDCSEYEGAKSVVMARRVRSNETTYVSPTEFSINAMPLLPENRS